MSNMPAMDSTTPYIETNRSILEQTFTELRWSILEQKLVVKNNQDPLQVMMQSVYGSPEENPNHNIMMRLLQQPIRFDGPERKINQRNYYVVKHRLTKYGDDIVGNEIRAGYMYVLVRKSNDVAVAFEYVHEGIDLINSTRMKTWAKWPHSDEGWIIYDGDDGHIKGNLSGSLME